MRSFACAVALILLSSCTVSSTPGTCQNPVVAACTDQATIYAADLAKAAAQRGTTPDEITTEFMNACEGQLQSDLDQTAAAISLIIADGGAQVSKH